MRKPKANGEDRTAEVNLTPLIDVSLVLVVILLIATPLAFESAIAVQRTAPSGSKAQDPTKVERVEVDILNDSLCRVNRREVQIFDLDMTLRASLENAAHPQVVVSCADKVSHGIFVEVLDTARLAGAEWIAVRE
jgi:biopolymer transport protein ExbD